MLLSQIRGPLLNIMYLSQFRYEIVRRWFKLLRRRSQRASLTWARYGPWVSAHLPSVRIIHEYPEKRFYAKYSKQEPYA